MAIEVAVLHPAWLRHEYNARSECTAAHALWQPGETPSLYEMCLQSDDTVDVMRGITSRLHVAYIESVNRLITIPLMVPLKHTLLRTTSQADYSEMPRPSTLSESSKLNHGEAFLSHVNSLQVHRRALNWN
jgi:hypothetical protein